MAFELKTTRRVEFAETDMAGIMHFSNFFRLMEATEHLFFRSLGFSIHAEADGATIGWPRVRAECDYSAPLRFEEEVCIHLLVLEVRRRSIRYAFVFRKQQNGGEIEVARGAVTAVCAVVEGGNLKPIDIPEPIRTQITAAPAERLPAVSLRTTLSTQAPD